MRDWEVSMAARDILTLNTSIAPRLIRCLYIVALILIAVMVVLGLARGVRVMTFQPPARPAIANGQAPAAPSTTQTPPGPGAQGPSTMGPGMMNPAQRQAMRQMRRFGPRRPIGPFGIGRNPVVGGLLIMLGALLRGAIALLVVRILAEIGLAILSLPRAKEI
jgi:hypothetical protein